MPENEYLIGQATHQDHCSGRAFNIRQLLVPWPSSVLSVLGLGAYSGPIIFGFGGVLWSPEQGHSVAFLSSW